jgi:sugar/nucleoside kinase (ribokinase family)
VSAPDPVLIVGSMAFDDLELPTTKAENVVGGAATYAALSASLFTVPRVVAVVGHDFPAEVLSDLERRGIDTRGIERADGPTFRWAGRYSEHLDSRVTLDTKLNVFADFRPRLPEHYRQTPAVLLGNIHPALQLEVLDQLERRPRLVVADTMNFWIEGERPTLQRLLSRVDTLVINDEELRLLASEHSIRKAARAVLAMGPERLVCKLGEHGSMLFDAAGIFCAPPYPLERAIDPTGAGDTFAGALVGYLCQTSISDPASLRRALLVASAVASFTVEDVGTRRLAALERDEMAARVAELEDMVRYPTTGALSSVKNDR